MTPRPVLVLHFGSQTAQLIARRVRDLGVYAQLVRHDLPAGRVRELNPQAIILSGGPASVYDAGAPTADPAILDLGIPTLGICYGMQWAARTLGGAVAAAGHREFGRTPVEAAPQATDDPLLAGVPPSFDAWMSHGDQIRPDPDQFQPLLRSTTCELAAVRFAGRPLYGLQFHPEVHHTAHGTDLLGNFLFRVAGCEKNWQLSDLLEQAVADIRQTVGDARVVCGLSGGVDSAVTAALLLRAVGPQTKCIFVDTGLLRKDERGFVAETFAGHFGADLTVADARDLFLSRLAGVTDPQQKRTAIGHTFIDVFRAEAAKIDGAAFLAQGTLYPDVIESGASGDGPAATIKHHHNVGGLPAELGFKLVEPLRDLFKDEARRLGAALGLPDEMVWRHPFPGPGLAVRCLGEVTEEKLAVLREADAIFIEELRAAGLYRQVGQAFAVLLPVQTVGVMGDGRTYERVVALRAVETTDFMTADWSPLPHDLLGRVSTRIINTVRGVNRVVYDVSTKPPATIEWE